MFFNVFANFSFLFDIIDYTLGVKQIEKSEMFKDRKEENFGLYARKKLFIISSFMLFF